MNYKQIKTNKFAVVKTSLLIFSLTFSYKYQDFCEISHLDLIFKSIVVANSVDELVFKPS